MEEAGSKREIKLSPPNLTDQQLRLRSLCEEILTYKPETSQTSIDLLIDTDPTELQQRLRDASFGKLLLADGQSLSADPPSHYQPDLGLYVGDAEPYAVSLRAWDWKYENAPTELGTHWANELDIIIYYKKDIQTAGQKISASSTSESPHIPRLSRDVFATAYMEMAYTGHNQQILRSVAPEVVDEYLGIATELFAKRLV